LFFYSELGESYSGLPVKPGFEDIDM